MYKFRPLFQSDELNTFIADIKCKPSGKTHKNVLTLQVISETFHDFSEFKVCQLFLHNIQVFNFSTKKIQFFWSKKAEFFHQITSNWLKLDNSPRAGGAKRQRFTSFEKNVQKNVQKWSKNGSRKIGNSAQKRCFRPLFSGISQIVCTNLPPYPARVFENVTRASGQA